MDSKNAFCFALLGSLLELFMKNVSKHI